MSNAVLSIAHDYQADELDSLLRAEDCPVRFIHVGHGAENIGIDTNLVRLARKNEHFRKLVATLVNRGFYTYMAKDNATRFVSEKSLDRLWDKLVSKEYVRSPEGIVYSYVNAVGTANPKRLLVVFSSISGNINTPSLMRYFEQNFRSIQKFVPPDTAVLRIADLGGVVGAFYMNTTHLPRNTENIQKVIEDIRKKYGIGHDSVVLYGASKGGTGALFHAIKGHYRCVAVDPIVDGEHYVLHLDDAHFTGNGIFPEDKERVFNKLMKELNSLPEPLKSAPARWSVICSDRSPQYKYISRLLIDNASSRMSFYNSRNPQIKDHPDVSRNTLNMTTSLLNLHLYSLPITAGLYAID